MSDEIADAGGTMLAAPETVSFQTGTFDCEHLTDCFEPNDDVTQAAAVETDRWHRTLATCDDDRDIFVFTVTETVKVTARTLIKQIGDWAAWHIDLMRSDGERYSWFIGGVDPGDEPSYSHAFLPRTYCLGLHGSSTDSYVTYDTELETSSPCRDDPYEDNDFIDEATVIDVGTTEGLRGCRVDCNVFWLDLVAGQTLTVTMTNDPFTGCDHTAVSILHPSGTELDGYSGTDDEVTVEATAAVSGHHYISVQFWADDVAYRLDVGISD